MQLLDDHLFRLWRDKVVTKEDVLIKANFPDTLSQKIMRYEAGLDTGNEEEDEEEEDNGKKK